MVGRTPALASTSRRRPDSSAGASRSWPTPPPLEARPSSRLPGSPRHPPVRARPAPCTSSRSRRRAATSSGAASIRPTPPTTPSGCRWMGGPGICGASRPARSGTTGTRSNDDFSYQTPPVFDLAVGTHQLSIANSVDQVGLDSLYITDGSDRPPPRRFTSLRSPPDSIQIGGNCLPSCGQPGGQQPAVPMRAPVRRPCRSTIAPCAASSPERRLARSAKAPGSG